MACLKRVTDKNGEITFAPKRQYDTLEEAIRVAKRLNSQEVQETKAVAYKCHRCFKYHVGRNGNPISDRDRKRYRREQI